MRRGRALLLTGLLLAGQLAALAHVVLVTHVTCPEHGDLVHPRQGQAATRASAAAWYPTSLGAGEEHADHCATALHQGDRLTATPVPEVRTSASVRALPCPRDTTGETPLLALFRLAPKTSPPLSA
jgi:hypothetical protein